MLIARLARAILTLILIGSVALTGTTAYRIATNSALTPFVDRTGDAIVAATDRALARGATPARIAERLEALLAEDPRNWIAIRGVQEVAAERGIAVAPDLQVRIDAAWAADDSLWSKTTGCLACAYDPANCELSAELICQAPMAITPLGDIAALINEGFAYTTGEDVDRLNLALALVGLGASALVIITGGTSSTIKLGAGAARMARQMGLLSPRLVRLADRSLAEGVDWARLPAARSSDDIAAAIRPAAFAPLAAIASDTARIARKAGPAEALNLLRHVDDAPEARRIANAAEALGPRTAGRIEVLGKGRFLRATVRFSDIALELLAGLYGLALSAAQLAASILTGMLRRGLRWLARAG